MNLNRLLDATDSQFFLSDEFDRDINGFSCDYKKCLPGFLYAAFTGETVDSLNYGIIKDGRDYIDLAIKNGAIAILTDAAGYKPHEVDKRATFIVTSTPNRLFSKLCAAFYVDQPNYVACVTGTNGKTSTVNFCRQIWNLLGHKAMSIGNFGTIDDEDRILFPAIIPFSVPETVTLYEMLKTIEQRGVDYMAMEATSHAIYEERIAGVRTKIAAFTSFSREHLDFHETMENYLHAKIKLFNEVLITSGSAVLNADMAEFNYIKQCCIQKNIRVISYGYKGEDIRLLNARSDLKSQVMTFSLYQKIYEVSVPFPGRYQLHNILCAIGIVMESGMAIKDILKCLPGLKGIPGRMQKIAEHNGGSIFLDDANDEHALFTTLSGIDKDCYSRLIIIVAAYGDRDTAKRPEMGKIASQFADIIIVTDSNPGKENPASIRKEIISTCFNAIEVAGRSDAISCAIDMILPNDILIIFGMGCSDYVEETSPHALLNDRIVLQKAIEALM